MSNQREDANIRDRGYLPHWEGVSQRWRSDHTGRPMVWRRGAGETPALPNSGCARHSTI
jgi:hypothetical protein